MVMYVNCVQQTRCDFHVHVSHSHGYFSEFAKENECSVCIVISDVQSTACVLECLFGCIYLHISVVPIHGFLHSVEFQ